MEMGAGITRDIVMILMGEVALVGGGLEMMPMVVAAVEGMGEAALMADMGRAASMADMGEAAGMVDMEEADVMVAMGEVVLEVDVKGGGKDSMATVWSGT